MLYFSYGSNMSANRLRSRVNSAKPIGACRLDGHRLAFHKKSKDGSAKCDALFTECSSDVVHGVVYRIDPNQKSLLDRAEGCGFGYEEKSVVVSLTDSSRVDAFTYYATSIDSSLKPYSWYRHHVLTGADEHNLPQEYVDQILKTKIKTDLDRDRQEREMRIHL